MPVPDGWQARALGDLVDARSGNTPKRSDPAYWGGETPWVGPADLYGRTVSDAPERLTPEGLSVAAAPANEGDVLMVVRSMALAKRLFVAQVTDGPVAFNQDIKCLTATNGLLPEYLGPLLWGSHDALHGLVDEASHGTKRLRSDVLFEHVLPVPPRSEQEAIATVLSTLDRKIESNDRLSDKAREVLMLALPDKGTKRALDDIAEFKNGGALTKYSNGLGRPILRIKELKAGVSSDTPRTNVEVRSDHEVRGGDLLFSWSGTLLAHRWSGEDALLNQHVFRVDPADGTPRWFVEAWVERHLNNFRSIAADKATTMGHIQRHHLSEAEVIVPAAEAMAQLRSVYDPLDELRMATRQETSTLSAVRDTLLPKLISGQIQVPISEDPEEQVGAAMEALDA